MNENTKQSFFKRPAVQSIIASLVCVILGLLIGFIVLLIIKPDGAFKGITDLIKNFFTYSSSKQQLKYFGTTLVKTAPLILCSLSIMFCYKVGLFNIGVAGQYTIGAGIALYAALGWGMSWWQCMILAVAAGALLAAITGVLKAYCNVNEVISGIMLNWISLYLVNILLTQVKEDTSPYTKQLSHVNSSAIIPSLGLDKLFSNNKYVTIGLLFSIIIAVTVYVLLEKTKFGYELKATGFNKNAAKYCGMAEKRNIIVTLVIGGMLAGMGASLFYLTGIEQWECSQSSVPAMGFNGIASAFLGGLNPIGAIFSSFFIQHITAGGAYVDKSAYCSQISDLISSIIIYLCGFSLFIKYLINKGVFKREEKRKKKAVAAAAEDAPAPDTDGKGDDE